MKNQYFGDVGDYGKYGMLRFLANHNIKIAVNWYLTADDGSNDGKHIAYLDNDKDRRYDPELFDLLKRMVSEGNRSIITFKEKDAIPNAVYYNEILSEVGNSKVDRIKKERNGIKKD